MSSALAETKNLLDIPAQYCPSHYAAIKEHIMSSVAGGISNPNECRELARRRVAAVRQMYRNSQDTSCYDSSWNGTRPAMADHYSAMIARAEESAADCERLIVQRAENDRRRKEQEIEDAARSEKRRQEQAIAAAQREAVKRSQEKAAQEPKRDAAIQKQIASKADSDGKNSGQAGNPISCYKLKSKLAGAGQWTYSEQNDCHYKVATQLNLCEADRSTSRSTRVCKNHDPQVHGPHAKTMMAYTDAEPQLVRVCNMGTMECYSPPRAPR